MERFIVELSNGERWELSATDHRTAGNRALHFGGEYVTVADVWTLTEWRRLEAERIAADYAAAGIVVTDRGVTA